MSRQSDVDKSRIAQRIRRGWDPEKARITPPLAVSVGGTRAARKMEATRPWRINDKISPEFIPGVRKPRADRPKRKAKP